MSGDPGLADGTRQAQSDFALFLHPAEPGPGGAPFRTIGYDGPCPGEAQAYVFTLYALTGTIDLPGGSADADIPVAIEAARADGSLMAEVTLTGCFGPGQ